MDNIIYVTLTPNETKCKALRYHNPDKYCDLPAIAIVNKQPLCKDCLEFYMDTVECHTMLFHNMQVKFILQLPIKEHETCEH